MAGNPGWKAATTTTVVAGNAGCKAATTTTVVAGNAGIVNPTAADRHGTATKEHATAISRLQSRGNLPLRNLG